jgi:hypothetical protein
LVVLDILQNKWVGIDLDIDSVLNWIDNIHKTMLLLMKENGHEISIKWEKIGWEYENHLDNNVDNLKFEEEKKYSEIWDKITHFYLLMKMNYESGIWKSNTKVAINKKEEHLQYYEVKNDIESFISAFKEYYNNISLEMKDNNISLKWDHLSLWNELVNLYNSLFMSQKLFYEINSTEQREYVYPDAMAIQHYFINKG